MIPTSLHYVSLFFFSGAVPGFTIDLDVLHGVHQKITIITIRTLKAVTVGSLFILTNNFDRFKPLKSFGTFTTHCVTSKLKLQFVRLKELCTLPR